ncbi:MAG: class I SAM-dependent methyltransferase, partial [Pirellulaceae bacterium]
AMDVEDFVAADLKKSAQVNFQVASVCELPFAKHTFDAIFYHHVIEHVDRPRESLVELHRVLRPGGWLFVGTPNRHRLISSIGAHQQSEWEATFANKVGDNLRDWKHRLTGQFRNELGAHAGFSQGELDKMLSDQFPTRVWLTKEYLQFKYSNKRFSGLLPLVTNSSVCWFAAPAIYVFCQK